MLRLLYEPSKHCVKSARIWSYFGPYSVRMRENKDQNNSEYRHFSRSEAFLKRVINVANGANESSYCRDGASKSHGDDVNDEFFIVRSHDERLETLCQARTLAQIKFGKNDYLCHDGVV